MFKALQILSFALFLFGCSQQGRIPASFDTDLQEFDESFQLASDLSVSQFGGRVFDCVYITRNQELQAQSVTFTKLGFLPLSQHQIMLTIGDGTNEGTIDSIAQLKDGIIYWKYKGGTLEIRANAETDQLLANSYVESDHGPVLVFSHSCSVITSN